MNTDQQVYRLFQANPEWLFKLTGLPSPGPSQVRSFMVKSLQRDADGVVVPHDAGQPLTVVEVQLQPDDTIYPRIVIGERAERLAYLNCFRERATLDRALEEEAEPYRIQLRTREQVHLPRQDFDDLCRVHLYDWLEQVPRSQLAWSHRREAFQRMAERLGGAARETYDRVFAQEPAQANVADN